MSAHKCNWTLYVPRRLSHADRVKLTSKAYRYVPVIVWSLAYNIVSVIFGFVVTRVFNLPDWSTPAIGKTVIPQLNSIKLTRGLSFQQHDCAALVVTAVAQSQWHSRQHRFWQRCRGSCEVVLPNGEWLSAEQSSDASEEVPLPKLFLRAIRRHADPEACSDGRTP